MEKRHGFSAIECPKNYFLTDLYIKPRYDHGWWKGWEDSELSNGITDYNCIRLKDYTTGTCTTINGKGNNEKTLCDENAFLTAIINPYGTRDVSTLTTS